MLRFRHLISGLFLMLALSVLPAFGQAYDREYFLQHQTFEDRLDPRGFCDLYWNETLNEIKSEYPVTFQKYDQGKAVYFIDMAKAPKWPEFKGPKKVEAFFKANKLNAVVVGSGIAQKEVQAILEKTYGKPHIGKWKEKVWVGPQTFIYAGPSKNKEVPSVVTGILYASLLAEPSPREIDEKEDPRGFDHLSWRDSIEEVKAKQPIQLRGQIDRWSRYLFTIPDVRNALFLKGPVFGSVNFYDGKLAFVEILREESSLELISEMKKRYGPPVYRNKDFCLWQGPYTLIYIFPSHDKVLTAVRSEIRFFDRSLRLGRKNPQ